jgi:ribonuclease HI
MKKCKQSYLARELRDATTLDEICTLLKIPDSWDCIICGDGSGTQWSKPGGYGWALIQRRPTFRRIVGSGGMSHGSNIVAELFAFLHPLSLLAQEKVKGVLRVFVLSDCKLMSDWGNGNKAARSAYEELFFLIGAYERRGLKIEYRWIPRDVINLNKLAHDLANVARKWQCEPKPGEPRIRRAPVETRKILKKLGAKDIYHVNPLE